MLKIGISMDKVKHAVEGDGLSSVIMDQDHNLPVITVEKRREKKQRRPIEGFDFTGKLLEISFGILSGPK
jgi:hypothetical protein